MFMQTPMYDTYKAVAPRPEDFPEFVARMGEAIRRPFDWSEDAKTLKPTTLLVYGDSDMFEPSTSCASTNFSAAGCATEAGTGRAWRATGWRSCRASPTTRCSDAPGLVDTALAFLEG
jgi:hypothetical protein